MLSLLQVWPKRWTREQRSAATMAVAAALLILSLWLLALPLAAMPEPIGPAARQFAGGARMTVYLTLTSGLLGVVVGILAAVGKLSRFLPLRAAATFYVWFIRGTPLLVQVLLAYFALPELLKGGFGILPGFLQPPGDALQFSDVNSAILALGFNVGAYNAEAIRGGLQAVPKGQLEAAWSLGLTPLQTFRDVVFPQAIKIALPSLVNNVVALLKDSSLAYVIGVVELSNVGNRLQAATFQPVPILITTASIYLLLTTILTQISGAVEYRLDVEQRH